MLAARYELVWLGDGRNFQDGPGAALAAELPARGFERLGFELSAYYRRPVEVSTDGVGARLQAISLRAAATAQLWRGQRSGIRLGFGLGADLVHVKPFAEAGSDVALAQSAWLKLALGRVHVCYARQLTSFMDLELALGLDLDLKDTRYVVQRAGVEQVVLEPWAFRPFISLGARVP